MTLLDRNVWSAFSKTFTTGPGLEATKSGEASGRTIQFSLWLCHNHVSQWMETGRAVDSVGHSFLAVDRDHLVTSPSCFGPS
jgi:hypothetical protein